MAKKGSTSRVEKNVADPVPVRGRADPVVVMTGAQEPREEREPDDHVEPLLDHFPVDAGHLDHQEGEDRGHHQFPDAFDPEMHDPPPVHLVERQVAGL